MNRNKLKDYVFKMYKKLLDESRSSYLKERNMVNVSVMEERVKNNPLVMHATFGNIISWLVEQGYCVITKDSRNGNHDRYFKATEKLCDEIGVKYYVGKKAGRPKNKDRFLLSAKYRRRLRECEYYSDLKRICADIEADIKKGIEGARERRD